MKPMKKRALMKRRFLLTMPKREEDLRCPPLEMLETCTMDMRMPLGVTPPSPTCLPDSVLALVCPKCLCIWYISRGLFRQLAAAQDMADALSPGLIHWMNPSHVSCGVSMRMISLSEEVEAFLPDQRSL